MNKFVENPERVMDTETIKEYLPHRYPFLLIDKVVDYELNQFLIAKKNVTINEDCFNGHFPSKAIYPGVLIVEGMAQTAAMLSYLSVGLKDPNYPVFFMCLDQCKFRAPVVPGDTIYFKITPKNIKRKVVKVQAEAYVDGKLVAQAVLTAMLGGANE